MKTADSLAGVASVARYLCLNSEVNKPWQLRWTPICASTELSLDRWLLDRPLSGENPRAFLASRQNYGKGQRGRIWESPKGGVWISTALPVTNIKNSAGILGLAVAVSMCERLEKNGVTAQIKWPNDLLVEGRKLAGILPRLVHRGNNLRLARVGIGLNVCNRAPSNAISLIEILRPINCQPAFWAAEVLLAVGSAMCLLQSTDMIPIKAKKLLWSDKLRDPITNELWDIDGISVEGELKVRKGTEKVILSRWS